jgi:anti-repressor protein
MTNLKVIENVEGFIPVYETDTGEKVVSGEELYKGLGVSLRTQTSDWIKSQLEKVDATDKDFFVLKRESTGGRPSMDYILKLEIAKEICLVAGASPRANETLKQKSKAYRKYLIQFEEKYKNQTLNLTEKQMLQLQILNGDEMERIGALKEYGKILTQPLLNTIEEQKPKVDWFNSFLNSEGLYTSTQVAKVLHVSSARKLNAILHEEKIIYRQNKAWLPYVSTDKSWYKLIVGNNESHSYSQLKFTPKGIYGISKILDINIEEEDIQSV